MSALSALLFTLVQAALGPPCQSNSVKPPAADYDALLAAASRERASDGAAAEALLTQAIALDPQRPEAPIARGHVKLLQGRYDEAVSDFRRALAVEPARSTKQLLVSALLLAARPEEALSTLNAVGEPALRSVRLRGLVQAPADLVNDLVGLVPPQVVAWDDLQAARVRLSESGLFEDVSVRVVPLDDGLADVEFTLRERRGFRESWRVFLLETSVQALNRGLALRYANLAGSGLSVGAAFRWQGNRERAIGFLVWPRPFRAPLTLHLQPFWRVDTHSPEDPIRVASAGASLRGRYVVDGRSLAQLEFSLRSRHESKAGTPDQHATIPAIEVGIDRRFVQTGRYSLAAALRVSHSVGVQGESGSYGRAILALQFARGSPAIGRSVLAARLQWGYASARTPIESLFVPGASPEMDWPLRGHYQARDGILGSGPMGRALMLSNLEWRQRLVQAGSARVELVGFYDGAWVGASPAGSRGGYYNDLGLGLRLGSGGRVVRVDYGRSLEGGAGAWSVGFGQAF